LDDVIVGLALTTTAPGTLLPILRDTGLLEGRFGSRIMAIGSVGEFGPSPRSPYSSTSTTRFRQACCYWRS
jgi:hypothetical protein